MRKEVGIPLVVLLISICVFTFLNRLSINAITNNHVTTIKNLKNKVERLENKTVQRQYELTVTAYTASEDETDSTPNTTALMQEPVSGKTVAVSHDLKRFLGAKVYIEGHGIRVVNDLMNKRFTKRIDIFVGTKEQARNIGKSVKTAVFYDLNI